MHSTGSIYLRVIILIAIIGMLAIASPAPALELTGGKDLENQEKALVSLSVSITGDGEGYVAVNGTVVLSPGATQQFESGTRVAIEAFPLLNSDFGGWTGNPGIIGADPFKKLITFIITGNIAFGASFNPTTEC